MQTAPPRERGAETVTKSVDADSYNPSRRPVQALCENLGQSYDRLTPADRTWLVGQGVPPHALDMYPGPIGASDDGVFLQPIMSNGAFSNFIGIVAWQQRDPSRFKVVDGDQDLDVLGLGQHLLLWAVDHRGSLAVTASPLEWLRHYGAAFCPLTWENFAVQFELMHLSRIIALPAAFGPELWRRLDQARPKLPRIEVAP